MDSRARERKHGTCAARGFFGARVCVVRVKVEKAGYARAPACQLVELACDAMDGAGAEKGGEAVRAARPRERKLLCASV